MAPGMFSPGCILSYLKYRKGLIPTTIRHRIPVDGTGLADRTGLESKEQLSHHPTFRWEDAKTVRSLFREV